MQLDGITMSTPISDINSNTCIHLRKVRAPIFRCEAKTGVNLAHMYVAHKALTHVHAPREMFKARRHGHVVHAGDCSKALVQADGRLELVSHPGLLPEPPEPFDRSCQLPGRR
eukprot:849625-Prymnesium_polylepis.1